MRSYDGNGWTLLNTGLSGTVAGLSGTSATRVFASASNYVGNSVTVGYVLAWDGNGWTQAVIPSGTAGLDGIYAAPNGEVFAVGRAGTILHGP